MAAANESKFNKLKKVIWPNRKQLINNTVTVLVSCLLVGALLWIIDLFYGQLTAWFFTR